jgi:hypothetical protein
VPAGGESFSPIQPLGETIGERIRVLQLSGFFDFI